MQEPSPGGIGQQLEGRGERLGLVAPDELAEQRSDMFRMQAFDIAAVGRQFHICTMIHINRRATRRLGARAGGEVCIVGWHTVILSLNVG